ncbi:hypothetical protein Tco_0684403, partial [Tanacetum coccineum]
MAPLPAADQRHPWLRYQIKEHTKGIRHSYEQRLETIWSKPVNQVYVLDFEGLTAKMRRRMTWRKYILALGLHTELEMAKARFGAYWARSDRLIPDKGDLRDYWMEISSDRDFLGPASSYVIIRDPPMDQRGSKLLRLVSADEAAEDVALEILALAQAPPQLPPAPQPRTMSQRIKRLEEEVHDLWRDVLGLRGDVASFTTEHSRVSTWLISCMTQLMYASGQTFQPFDSTLIGSLGLSFRRCVRPRISDASTSVAPHTDAQPDP